MTLQVIRGVLNLMNWDTWISVTNCGSFRKTNLRKSLSLAELFH